MSVKLPEPLPYEYVDELIDDKFTFEVFDAERDEEPVKIFVASLRDPHQYRGNFAREFMSLIDTNYEYVDEDPDGYVNMPLAGGMKWRAEPLTEEELEFILLEMVDG